MSEHTYLCHGCGNIFRVAADDDEHGAEMKCPQCGKSQVRDLPSWLPLGSDAAQALAEWEYECQQCKTKFRRPVPGSPTEERDIKCPDCSGGHIHRLTRTGYEPLYCG